MKKILLSILALVPLVMIQCSPSEMEPETPGTGQNPDEPGDEPSEETETVTLILKAGDLDVVSKAVAGMDGKIFWEDDDEVYINGDKYAVVPDEEDRSSATVDKVEKSENYVAFAGAPGKRSGSNYVIDIATEQKYAASTVSGMAASMVASGAGEELEFSSIGSVIRIGVKGQGTITEMTLASNDGSSVAGSVLIPEEDILETSYSDTYPVDGKEASDKVVLSGMSVSLGSSETWFHFVVAPKTYEEGFTLYLTDSEDRFMIYQIEDRMELHRSAVTVVEPFDYSPLYAPEIEIGTVEQTSVEYGVSAIPGMCLGSALVLKSAWDAQESDSGRDAFVQRVLKASSMNAVAVSEEVTHFTAESAFDANLTVCKLEPETEYVIIAGYFDKDEPLSVYATENVTTAPASELPHAEAELDPGVNHNELIFTIKATGAESVRYNILHIAQYEEYRLSGMTDEQLLEPGVYNVELLEGDDLEKAATFGYSAYFSQDVQAENGYIILVRADFPDGTVSIVSDEAVSAVHIPGNAVWEHVSDDAFMSFEYMSWSGLRTEKVKGLPIYRIESRFNKDLDFIMYMEARGMKIDETPSDKYYVYVDVTGDYAELEPYESFLGFVTTEESELIIHNTYIGFPVFIRDNGISKYENNGRITVSGGVDIYCGIQSMSWFGMEELVNHESFEVSFASVPPASGGLTNEDYGMEDEIEWQ